MTLHEIGHSLGLGDNFDTGVETSVMNQFSRDPGKNRLLGGWRDDPLKWIALSPTSCDVEAVIKSGQR